ncbi:molecular chaperone HtpG [Comamonas serinivorans]|uniref:Chaperone protein HtpG n=1 Tax=Comamonas serinivorans TaxID=1082851 RepID=A0A1Y0ES05_9BURK|nr:molecular chaperone HtpG [Comamonas serinivorans]ARU06444.1 molecular chaperone HtpG [Comamonas serinivorans]
MSKHAHSFQAEVAQLLHLVTHSLYSNSEIFLRELISNASDACDKLRFAAIADATLYEDQPNLDIRIAYDQDARTLSITDTGIGMSEADAIANLGTIAKSGTREFMGKLTGDQKADSQLIGQFGVGFYSGFIVADRITVESRQAGLPAEQGVRWESAGTGDFSVEAISRAARGTTVTLHLREDALEYASNWKLKELIGKYSDHIGVPILLEKETWQEGEEGQPGGMVKTGEWETANQASALWTRPKKDISDEQYRAFYTQTFHDHDDPLAWTHNRVEGSTEYTQLLYLPGRAPMDLFQRDAKTGVKLYVKRVFIMDDASALLPNYLRFVRGVVDSADLPLNVSRELLQESRDVRAIRDGNTRRVLGMIEDLANKARTPADSAEGKVDIGSGDSTPAPEPTPSADGVTDVVDKTAADEAAKFADAADRFTRFYSAFGVVLKEGLGEDFGNQQRIAKLLRFASTTTDTVTVSFADYKARMKDGQEAIYYITADSLTAARNSPQLELFRKKGIEVLLMGDRVDEWAMGFLTEFDGTPLQSVAKGAVDLGSLQDEGEAQAAEAAAEQLKPVLEQIKQALSGQVEDVRVTTRLVDSPACLVVKDAGMSLQLARLLKQAGQPVPEVKPVLEVNPEHALIQRLQASADSPDFGDLAHVIFDQALLAEGGLPEDPASYVRRVNALLTK